MKELTRKQEVFVSTYVATGNGTQSALAAYDTKDENTAAVIAVENLSKPKIVNALLDALPEVDLGAKHRQLLNSTRIEHMVFPLGPVDEDDINLSGAIPNKQNDMEDYVERTTLTDQEIIQMLAEVNCKVRRIVHGNTARHVYYWAVDNKAVKDALDMAYKLRGDYAPEKRVNTNLNVTVEPNQRIKDLAKKLNS